MWIPIIVFRQIDTTNMLSYLINKNEEQLSTFYNRQNIKQCYEMKKNNATVARMIEMKWK